MIEGKRRYIYRNIDLRGEPVVPEVTEVPEAWPLLTPAKKSKNNNNVHSTQWPPPRAPRAISAYGKETPNKSGTHLDSLGQFAPRERKHPINHEFWKENILKFIEIAGEDGITRKEILEKTTKVLHLGIGHYNQLNKLVDELSQEKLIFEPKKNTFKFILQEEFNKLTSIDKIESLIDKWLDESEEGWINVKPTIDCLVQEGFNRELVIKVIDENTRRGIYFESQVGRIQKA